MKLSLLTVLCFVGAAPPARALQTIKTSMTHKQQEARRKLQEAVAKRNLQGDDMMEFLGEIWSSLPELFGEDFEMEDIFPGFGDPVFEGEALYSDMPSMMPSDMPSMMPSDMPSMMPSDTPSMTPIVWEDTGDEMANDVADPDDEEGDDPDVDRDAVFQPEGDEEGGSSSGSRDPDADPDAVRQPDQSEEATSSEEDGADKGLIIPLTVGLVAGLVAVVLALFVYRGRRRTRAAAAVEAGDNAHNSNFALEEGYASSDGDGGGPSEPHTDDDDNDDEEEEHVDEEGAGAYGPESPRQGSIQSGLENGNSEKGASAYEMSDIGSVESKSTGRLSPQLSNTVTL